MFKFQVEDLNFDVNRNYHGIFFYPRPGASQRAMPLLLHAILHSDERFLEYLVSMERFEANPLMERDLDEVNIRSTGNTFLHELHDIVDRDLLPGEMKLDRIEVLLQRKEINLDIQNIPIGLVAFETHTPLETCCVYARKGKRRNDLLKIYLTHGAKVSDFALDEAWRRRDREMYDLLQQHRSRS